MIAQAVQKKNAFPVSDYCVFASINAHRVQKNPHGSIASRSNFLRAHSQFAIQNPLYAEITRGKRLRYMQLSSDEVREGYYTRSEEMISGGVKLCLSVGE